MSEDPQQPPFSPPELHLVQADELPPQISQSPAAMAHEEHGYSMHTPAADQPSEDPEEWGVKVTKEEPPEITPEQAQAALKRIDEMIDANNAGERNHALDMALHNGRRFLELNLSSPDSKPGDAAPEPSSDFSQ